MLRSAGAVRFVEAEPMVMLEELKIWSRGRDFWPAVTIKMKYWGLFQFRLDLCGDSVVVYLVVPDELSGMSACN